MSEWLPGARQSPQEGGVQLDTSLPPRAVWHITWDQLTNGVQPPRQNVSGYLQRVGYCPHIMWDPFTGDIEQFYPASVGGRALKYNNQDGSACIQIEVFFTPGCVVNGKVYNTVVETPCVGLDRILNWLDGLGIPRVWPMGAPRWQGNSRDIPTWNNNAGHYGHCNSPGDDHTDPGPMPSLTRGAVAPQGTTTPEEDTLSAAEADRVIKEVNAYTAALLIYGYQSDGKRHPGVAKVVDQIEGRTTSYLDAPVGAVPAKSASAVWSAPVKRDGQLVPALQELADAKTASQQALHLAPAAAPAVDVKALATEIAAHLTTNQAHQFIVELGKSLPKE